MNANELADYLKLNVGASVDSDNQYIDKAVIMLRQLQIENEELKALNKLIIDDPLLFMRMNLGQK